MIQLAVSQAWVAVCPESCDKPMHQPVLIQHNDDDVHQQAWVSLVKLLFSVTANSYLYSDDKVSIIN